MLPVAKVTTLDEVLELALSPATVRVGEFEWPKEVGSLLEVGATGEDFVDKILDGEDVELAESLLNDGVVGKGNALLLDLSISTLVDQLAHRLEIRFTRVD